jgi:uncharacterized protein (DUF983 family)
MDDMPGTLAKPANAACHRRGMDELMLLGEERLCPDCGTETLFLPVDAEALVCTECEVAVPTSVTAA